MKTSDLLRWNVRVSALYAVGIWSLLGSFAYYRFRGRYEDPPAPKQEDVQEQEVPNQVIHQTAHNKTVVVYKKDFVPYHTRIYDVISSFSSEAGTTDSDK